MTLPSSLSQFFSANKRTHDRHPPCTFTLRLGAFLHSWHVPGHSRPVPNAGGIRPVHHAQRIPLYITRESPLRTPCHTPARRRSIEEVAVLICAIGCARTFVVVVGAAARGVVVTSAADHVVVVVVGDAARGVVVTSAADHVAV